MPEAAREDCKIDGAHLHFSANFTQRPDHLLVSLRRRCDGVKAHTAIIAINIVFIALSPSALVVVAESAERIMAVCQPRPYRSG